LHTELLVRSVFEAPTIAELAAAIVKLEQHTTVHKGINKRIDAQRAGDLLSKVDELSESELDTLLAEMLAEEKFTG